MADLQYAFSGRAARPKVPTPSLCFHRPPFLVGVSRWKCPLCRGANLRCQPRYSTRKDVTPPLPLSLPLFFAPFVSVLYPVQPSHPQNYVHSENECSSEPRPSKANKNASCTVKRHVFDLISRNDNSHYFLPAPYFHRRLLGTAHQQPTDCQSNEMSCRGAYVCLRATRTWFCIVD